MRPASLSLARFWVDGWRAYLRGLPASAVPCYVDARIRDTWMQGYEDSRYRAIVEAGTRYAAPDRWACACRVVDDALGRIAHA